MEIRKNYPRYFYVPVVEERDGKFIAYPVRMTAEDDLFAVLRDMKKAIKQIGTPTSKEDADEQVKQWNKCFLHTGKLFAEEVK